MEDGNYKRERDQRMEAIDTQKVEVRSRAPRCKLWKSIGKHRALGR